MLCPVLKVSKIRKQSSQGKRMCLWLSMNNMKLEGAYLVVPAPCQSVKCLAVQTGWVVGVLLCGHLFSSLARFQVFALSSAGSLIVLLVSCGLHRGQHASPVPPTLLSI